MLLFPTLSKTSARWPTVALLPSCCFHEIKRAFALSRLVLYSSSRLWIFDAEMSRFEPTTRQQVPTSSLMSESCNSVTSSFLGSGIVPKKKWKRQLQQIIILRSFIELHWELLNVKKYRPWIFCVEQSQIMSETAYHKTADGIPLSLLEICICWQVDILSANQEMLIVPSAGNEVSKISWV